MWRHILWHTEGEWTFNGVRPPYRPQFCDQQWFVLDTSKEVKREQDLARNFSAEKTQQELVLKLGKKVSFPFQTVS